MKRNFNIILLIIICLLPNFFNNSLIKKKFFSNSPESKSKDLNKLKETTDKNKENQREKITKNATIKISERKNSEKENSKDLSNTPIKIKIFYDTLCGDSRFYFKNSFKKLYKSIIPNYQSLFEIKILPGSKENSDSSYWNENSNNYNSFTCKHGENECFGNAVHACSIKFLDLASGFEFAMCYFDNIREFGLDIRQASEFCFKQISKEDLFSKVMDCAMGIEGKREIENIIKIRKNVNGEVNNSPAVVLNNEYTWEKEDDLESDTVGYICKNFKTHVFSTTEICTDYNNNSFKNYFYRVNFYTKYKKEMKKHLK